MQLTDILSYPLKSAAGLSVDRARVEPRGLTGDRRWMVVDADGHFITARTMPQMSLIKVESQSPATLTLTTESAGVVHTRIESDAQTTVTVWGDKCQAVSADDSAHRYLSEFLGIPCRLVYMPDTSHRPISPPVEMENAEVSFADGYPLLLISEGSLQDLNTRLETPVPMARFRPNLVVNGVPPYGEEHWRRLRIGDVEFVCCEPCERCVLTTVDPTTGTFDARGEPLRTLATYRRRGQGVIFGMNLIPLNEGTVFLGQSLEVLEQHHRSSS